MDNSEALLQGKSRDDSNDYHKLSGILNYEIEDNKIIFNFEHASLAVKFLTADIFRVTMAHSNQEINFKSTAAVIEHQLSYTDYDLEEKEEEIVIKTEALVLKIKKDKFIENEIKDYENKRYYE